MRLGLIAVKDVGLYAILTRLGVVVSASRLCAHRHTWDANERDATEAVAGHLAANDESETAAGTLEKMHAAASHLDATSRCSRVTPSPKKASPGSSARTQVTSPRNAARAASIAIRFV